MTNDLSGTRLPGTDSWQRLSESFAEGGGITTAFSTKVADFLAARPGYPRALLEHLAGLPGMDNAGAHRAPIADLGSGTGLLSAWASCPGGRPGTGCGGCTSAASR